MEAAFAELPLAFFTTFVLIGSGVFILQAFALSTSSALDVSDVPKKKLDMLSFVPLLIVGIGFAAAFVHLASPLNAPFALVGIGRSPMSNEIAMGSLFVVVALVYCVLVSAGRLSAGARKGFAIAVGILGVLFALFTGLAYFMNTIISWHTPFTVAETLGFTLFAGGVLCSLLLDSTGRGEMLHEGSLRAITLSFVIVGAVLGFGALILHVAMVSGFETASVSGATLVQGVIGCLVLAVACAIASVVAASVALLRKAPVWVLPAACVLSFVAVFVARLVFYAMQMSIAL